MKIMKTISVLMVMFILSVSLVSAYDLDDYPKMFIEGSQFDGVIVVGDSAPANNVVGAVDIAASIKSRYCTIITANNGGGCLSPNVPAAKLASEVINNIEDHNMIVVGNACYNTVTYELLGHPSDCRKGLEEGEAKIQLIQRNGKNYVLVYGYDATSSGDRETRMATKVLSNWDEYDLRGNLMCVSGSSSNPQVSLCSASTGGSGGGVIVPIEEPTSEPYAKIWMDDDVVMRTDVKFDNNGLLSWQFLDDKGVQILQRNARNEFKYRPYMHNWETVRLTLYYDGAHRAISNEIRKSDPQKVCRDYDGGYNYRISSYIIDEYGTKKTDYCRGSEVVEYACSNGKGTDTRYACKNGCYRGACKDEVVVNSCGDNDGGKNYYRQGTVYIGNNQYTDFCYNYDAPVNSGEYGSCDGDEDGCVLVEHSCAGTSLSKSRYTCPNGCSNGACITTVTPQPGCIDSDGGDNIYVAGEAGTRASTSVQVINGERTSLVTEGGRGTIDFCTFNSNSFGVLNEAVCNEAGEPDHKIIPCPRRTPYCNRGVCSSVSPKCTDTDGGNNAQIRGTITEPRFSDGPQHTDYCQDINTKRPLESCSGSSCGIREYYCADPYRSTTYADIKCPEGCRDGRCVGETQKCPMLAYPRCDSDEKVETYYVGGCPRYRCVEQNACPDIGFIECSDNLKPQKYYIDGCPQWKCVRYDECPSQPNLICKEGQRTEKYYVDGCPRYRCVSTQECPTLWAPVCGVDGRTYSNKYAGCGIPEGVEIACKGECPCEQLQCGSGCPAGTSCLPIGTRIVHENRPSYCDIANNVLPQKSERSACQNNYECLSNQCSNGHCVDFERELKETQGMMQKIINWLGRIFG